MRPLLHIVAESIARQGERIDGGDNKVGIQKSILIVRVTVVDGELQRLWLACREIGPCAIGEGEILAASNTICFRIVVLNEAPGAADHIESHEVAPIVGIGALLNGRQRAHWALMATDELYLTDLPEHTFRTDAEVGIFGDKEPQLVSQVEVRFVVRRG